MLQRESRILAKNIYHGSRRFQVSFGRSIAAVTAPQTSTKQLWRNTRKKVGPSTSKAAVQEAEKKLVNESCAKTVSSKAAAAKLINNEELPKYNWVPPAYRGLADETKPGNSVRRHQLETIGMGRPRRVDKPKNDRYILYSKDWVVDVPAVGLPEQVLRAKKRKEDSIMNDVLTLKKTAISYRTHLCNGDVTKLDENQKESSMSFTSKAFQQQIASTIRSLHVDVTTNTKCINDSTADFLSLCQILQQICSASYHLSTLHRYNDQDAIGYVDLAEFTLLGLVQINHDRAAVLDQYYSIENAKNESKSTLQISVTGWFNQIVEGLTPSLLTPKKSSHRHRQAASDENDKLKVIPFDLSIRESMKRLLRNVMAVIASTAEGPEIPLVAQLKPGNEINAMTNTEVKSNDGALGQRMITLLGKTWSLGIRDIEATQKAMDVLARTGTLESARRCRKVYHKYISKDRYISFIVVFEAYLEAIKRETDQEKIHDIVKEVMKIQDSNPLSSHRVERILQAATILNCLAVADMGKVDGMCARAELILRRALRDDHFNFFLLQVKSDNPTIESDLVPIANYLAQLYATSGEPQLEKKSVSLLRYAITDCCDGFNALTIYPTTDACNAVLKVLAQAASEKESSSVQYDYKFGRKVLKSMFWKAEMGSAPNQTTYDSLFSLLEATDARDIGKSGEELLSYIEMSNLLYISSTFSLPYHTYYRVLHYYLKTAKDSSPSTEIDEKSLPYRRAAHLLRKLEIRSTPMVLHNVALDEIAVKNLYSPQLRPYSHAYEVVMQICANTSLSQYQDEAADVAIEIYRTRFQYDNKIADCWDTVLENCSNEKLVERVKALNEQNM